MASVRVFQIPVEHDQKIIYVPEIRKIYLVPQAVSIPTTIDVPDHHPAPQPLPRQLFRRCDLILNNFCNLRCIYCYANAGVAERKEMEIVVAQRAIDRVTGDCQKMGARKFSVTLTGGGEPLLSFRLVQQIVEYARRKGQQTSLESKVAIVSNGNFSSRVCGYVAEWFDNISISVDGLPHIHDLHRPTAGGRGSFVLLAKNVDRLLSSGRISVGFRMTVSSHSVEQLPEHVLYLHRRWPGVLIGVEALEYTGRCMTTGTLIPDPLTFAAKLLETLRVAREAGIKIRHSAITFKAMPETISFCGVNGRIFGVDPDGNMTACTRVNSSDDPLAPYFFYGAYDVAQGDFRVDERAYQNLGRLTVDNVPGCEDCFARYSCKGDCCHLRATTYGQDFPFRKSPKCHANRFLTLGLLRLELGLP